MIAAYLILSAPLVAWAIYAALAHLCRALIRAAAWWEKRRDEQFRRDNPVIAAWEDHCADALGMFGDECHDEDTPIFDATVASVAASAAAHIDAEWARENGEGA